MKVIDMHCDTIAEIWNGIREGKPISLFKSRLQIDLEKMKMGDYLLQNFAMFVNLGEDADPLESVLQLIDVFYQEIEKYPERIGFVKTYQDIEKNIEDICEQSNPKK